MKRNFKTEGIILKNNRIGEIHKGVVFLSPEYGLMDAVAYGAYSGKGKLRSITNPLCSGTLFIYRDPVKEANKVSDMDCREFFEGIRESLSKFFIASVWMETILKTFGGEAAEVYGLLREGLGLLNGCPEERGTYLLVQFLWRYLKRSGSAPDPDECSRCGNLRGEGEGLLYFRGSHGLLCRDCAGLPASGEGGVELSPGALRYLGHSLRIPLDQAARIDLDPRSLSGLKKTTLALIEDLAGFSLNSVRTGEGVL